MNETHFNALYQTYIKMSQVAMMLGCTEDQANEYLERAGGDVIKAIADNVVIPLISGAKYIPEPPTVADGLTDEVREKLSEARNLSALFNASLRNDLVAKPERTVEVSQLPEFVALQPALQSSEQLELPP